MTKVLFRNRLPGPVYITESTQSKSRVEENLKDLIDKTRTGWRPDPSNPRHRHRKNTHLRNYKDAYVSRAVLGGLGNEESDHWVKHAGRIEFLREWITLHPLGKPICAVDNADLAEIKRINFGDINSVDEDRLVLVYSNGIVVLIDLHDRHIVTKFLAGPNVLKDILTTFQLNERYGVNYTFGSGRADEVAKDMNAAIELVSSLANVDLSDHPEFLRRDRMTDYEGINWPRVRPYDYVNKLRPKFVEAGVLPPSPDDVKKTEASDSQSRS